MSYNATFINANRIKITPNNHIIINPKSTSEYVIGNNNVSIGDSITAGLKNLDYTAKVQIRDLYFSKRYNSLEAIEFHFNESNLFVPPLIGIDNIIKNPDHQYIINCYVNSDREDFTYGSQAIVLCRYFPFEAYSKFLETLEKSDFFLRKVTIGQFDLLYFRVSNEEEFKKLLEGKYSSLNEAIKQKLLNFNNHSPYIKGVLGLDNSYKKKLADLYDIEEDYFNELEKPLKNSPKCNISLN